MKVIGIPEMEWRLAYLMLDKGIRKNVELQKMLADKGYEISLQQLGRLINNPPERINCSLLLTLCSVFQCDISDIMRIDPMSADYTIKSFDYQNLRYRDFALSPSELYQPIAPKQEYPKRVKSQDQSEKVSHLLPPKLPK